MPNEPPRIRIATSDPKLKDKIQINLEGPIDNVYWYIRFNIPLDEESVNDKTMEVTDTEGYIMRTDISYQGKHNRIVISPLDRLCSCDWRGFVDYELKVMSELKWPN